MAYKFQDEEVQRSWEGFMRDVVPEIYKIGDHVPKRQDPTEKELTEAIRSLTEASFQLAKWLGTLEYFHETAYSSAMMDAWEKNPKANMTLLKAQADGEIANITGILGKASHTWKALEMSVMGCQSLLRRSP